MKTVSTKVPKQLEEQIDAYAEEIEETRSVAMRKLLREGLDAENQEGTNPIEGGAITAAIVVAALTASGSVSLIPGIASVALALAIIAAYRLP